MQDLTVMGARSSFCFPHFPLAVLKVGAALGSVLCCEQVEGLASASALPSPMEVLAGEQSPSRRRLAVWVAFTAQAAASHLLQGEGGNCLELVL